LTFPSGCTITYFFIFEALVWLDNKTKVIALLDGKFSCG
jgi:hypothetical protein